MQPIFFWVMVGSFLFVFMLHIYSQMKLETARAVAIVLDDEGRPVSAAQIGANAHPRYLSKWEYLNAAFNGRRQLYDEVPPPNTPARS
jgi:hypothetical protein